jgi:hypothetical protein
VIAATANEAPYVLDGLLYLESSLVINEHHTDTGGFSDHVFAMCRLLGFRFAQTPGEGLFSTTAAVGNLMLMAFTLVGIGTALAIPTLVFPARRSED